MKSSPSGWIVMPFGRRPKVRMKNWKRPKCGESSPPPVHHLVHRSYREIGSRATVDGRKVPRRGILKPPRKGRETESGLVAPQLPKAEMSQFYDRPIG
jgi:hypothetical protein